MQRILAFVFIAGLAAALLLVPARVLEQTPANFGLPEQALTQQARPAQAQAADASHTGERKSMAWTRSTLTATRDALAVSGLQDFPPELVMPIEALPRPTGDRLVLDLGAAGSFEAPIQTRTLHANGDETMLVRASSSDSEHNHAELLADDLFSIDQAVLTYGKSGVFGRIQHASGLYLVHSDAAGSWLVNLNDDRLSVDPFDHDTLGESVSAQVEHAASNKFSADPGSTTSAVEKSGSTLQSEDDLSIIDVMFAYTPALQDRYPGDLIDTRFNHLVGIANQTFVDTQVPIAVRRVGKELVNYSASQSNSETLGNLQSAISGEGSVPGFANLASRRDQLGADIVAFTWPHDIETRGSCGIAFFPVFDNGSFDSDFGVHIDNDGFSNWSVCSDAVFTHELGHNLNAEHQRPRSSGDDPDRSNYAFIESGRFHTIMGSFGTGDQDRYLRLDRFSNPAIQCGGQPCGSSIINQGANNAAEITRLAPSLASYRNEATPALVIRPDPSETDQDGDGQIDQDDAFPFDPFNGGSNPDPEPELVFSPRALAAASENRTELLVLSSGSDQVLAFSPDGEFRSVAIAPERVNPGPILSDFSDILVADDGRITLLSSADVRRYDRLSGRLIEVFLGSRRPVPNDLLSPFPRALTTLPGGQLVVLGDSAIERYDDQTGALLTRLVGAEPSTDPEDWDQRLGLSMRAAAHWALKLYVAEATENRILRFSAASGAREADLAGPGNGQIIDPRDLAFDSSGLLYLANGRAGNVLRYDPASNQFVDVFINSGSGGLSFARALAFGPDGDLYVADRERNNVLRFNGDTGAFEAVVVADGKAGLDQPEAMAFVSEVNETVAGTSGHFFAPERAGEGYLLERLSDTSAAISWFTYPPSGDSAEQAWLVGVGEIDGNRVHFEELLVTTGAGFGTDFDPDSFESAIWGELTLEFYDCNSGIARWQGPEDWGSGNQRFDRLIEIPGLPCGSESLPATPERPGISGQWFEPSRSGQGWFIEEVSPGELFIAWYSYDSSGQQFWLVGSGTISNGIAQFDELLRPVGTAFGDNFDPAEVELIPWGSLTFTFSDCANAVAQYSALNESIGDGVLFPERLTRLDGLECEVP